MFSVQYSLHTTYGAIHNIERLATARTERKIRWNEGTTSNTKRFPKITRKANFAVCFFFSSSLLPDFCCFFFSTHIECGVSVCLAFFHIFSSYSSVRFYSFFYYFQIETTLKYSNIGYAVACSPIFNSITSCRHNIIAFRVSFILMRLVFFLIILYLCCCCILHTASSGVSLSRMGSFYPFNFL